MVRSHTERPAMDEPGRRGLFVGIVAYRWAALVWMTVLAITTRSELRRPAAAFVTIVAVIAWNIVFTLRSGWERAPWRWVDLSISFALLPFAGLVMEEGGAAGGSPFFATSYPAASALTVGAAGTPASGLAAGGAAGVVSGSLARSATERDRAIEDATRERERAARLAERDAIGREIHDSVLQSLALVVKEGRELTTRTSVSPEEVHGLLEVVGRQEHALRELLSHPRTEAPTGAVSLRTALAAAAFGIRDVPVTVSATAGAWMPAGEVDEVVAAVRQALENAERHAQATRVTVFAEAFDGEVVVSVRDDGVGFTFDEERLARDGKMGLLRSMRGRAEALGGSMTVRSAPGHGTEVEFRFPRQAAVTHG